MKKILTQFLVKEDGQSLVLVALFLSFLFLALAALVIDGTTIYLHRRELQNIADAGALAGAIVLAEGKTDAETYQVVMDTIAANDGQLDWYSSDGVLLAPNGNVGSDLGLTKGIEIINGCQVRVALQWSDIGTYFAQFVGRGLLQVGARAQAGCNRAGGLQPIAVKRFGDERDWNLKLKNVNKAKIYCDSCTTRQSLSGTVTMPAQGLGNAHDFLRPDGSDTIAEWPGGWPIGPSLYQSPSPHADLASGAPGREYFILGSGVTPNVGTVSYAGLVNLDIRNISDVPEYYNGVQAGTQSNTLKDLAEYYIRRGYCCDIPKQGDQLAVYNGNSTAFAAQAFQETYAVGDTVAVIVFDGHVINTPNLSMEAAPGTPYHQTARPITTTTAALAASSVTYDIDFQADSGFVSSIQGLVMDVQGLAGFADWHLSPTDSPVLGGNGATQATITLHVTPTVTTVGTTTHVVTGTRMFYVSAIDSNFAGTNIRRYWAGVLTVGDEVDGTPRDMPAITGIPTNSGLTYPFLSVVKGNQAKYQLNLDAWGVSTNQDITVDLATGYTLPTGFSWVDAPPWTKTTQYDKHPGSSFIISLKIDDTATASAIPYAIPLIISAPGIGSQTFELYIRVEETKASVSDYVVVVGYATLEITGYYNAGKPVNPGQNANAVRGRIVSALFGDPSDLTYGLRARLIPWGQQ